MYSRPCHFLSAGNANIKTRQNCLFLFFYFLVTDSNSIHYSVQKFYSHLIHRKWPPCSFHLTHNAFLSNHYPRRAPHSLHPSHDPLNRRRLLNDRPSTPNAPLPDRRRPSNQKIRSRRQRHLYVDTGLEGTSPTYPFSARVHNADTVSFQSQEAPEPLPS